MTRQEIRAQALDRLPTLGGGETARFTLPTGQVGRRILYGCVAAVAYRLFGAGGYRMQSDGLDILVIRQFGERQ